MMASAANGGGTKITEASAAGLVDSFLHRVEDRPAFVRGASLAGSHSADDLRAIFRAGLGVECAFPPGQSLHDHPRRFINQNAH